jgi:hypothetical protein
MLASYCVSYLISADETDEVKASYNTITDRNEAHLSLFLFGPYAAPARKLTRSAVEVVFNWAIVVVWAVSLKSAGCPHSIRVWNKRHLDMAYWNVERTKAVAEE